MNKIENTSAFPVLKQDRLGDLYCADTGMTLRDLFATTAMSTLIASPNIRTKAGKSVEIGWEDFAKTAYDIADAMMAVRTGHKPIDIDHMLAVCVPGGSSGDAIFHDDKRLPGVMEDAHLIAAAPDMLEALKAALSLIEIVIPFDGEVNRMARNAIAKAEGGTA